MAGRTMLLGLVGGLGSRPWPLTAHPKTNRINLAKARLNEKSTSVNAFPKPLVPLGGTPLMLPLFLMAVEKCGIQDIAMALMYMPEDIRAYFGPNMERLRQGTGSSYYWEHQREYNLNTAGCLVRGWQLDIKTREDIPDNYIILSADIRARVRIDNLLSYHQQYNALITIGLAPVPWEEVGRFGVVVREGDRADSTGRISVNSGGKYSRIIRFEEKNPNATSNLNNASIYIVNQRLFTLIEDDIKVPENRNQLDPRLSEEERAERNPYNLPIPNRPLDPSRGNYANDWTDPNTGEHYRLGTFSSILKALGKIQEGEANKSFQDWGGHIFPDVVIHHPEIYEAKDPQAPKGLFGYLIDGLWSDDGTRSALYTANHQLLKEMGGFNNQHNFDWWPKPKNITFDPQHAMIWRGENVTIEEGAQITGPTIIGNNVTIKRGAEVRGSVIGDGWTIGDNTQLFESVLWPSREFFDLVPLNPSLIHSLSDVRISQSIIGGGFHRPIPNDNDFYTDFGGNYIQKVYGARFLNFRRVAMVPSPAGHIVVTHL